MRRIGNIRGSELVARKQLGLTGEIRSLNGRLLACLFAQSQAIDKRVMLLPSGHRAAW